MNSKGFLTAEIGEHAEKKVLRAIMPSGLPLSSQFPADPS
jgi:hypothetical protein